MSAVLVALGGTAAVAALGMAVTAVGRSSAGPGGRRGRGLGSGWVVGLATVVAPATMTYYLVWVTGARPLEQVMMQRPAYRVYARRTSMFVPLPPRG